MNSFVVRISKGKFVLDPHDNVSRLVNESAESLKPAIQRLRGLVYHHGPSIQ